MGITLNSDTLATMLSNHLRQRVTTTVVAACVIAGCGGSDTPGATTSTDEVPTIAAALWPIEEILREVGGDRIEILRLTSPGSEAHDTQLTAKMLEDLGRSAAVVYLGQGFQPSVERGIEDLPDRVARLDLLAGITLLEGADGHDGSHAVEDPAGAATDETDAGHEEEGLAGGKDPHVWLSPANMILMTRQVTGLLTEIDPTNTAAYEGDSARYVAELTALDSSMSASLTSCETTTFVTNHQAFGYLADRYGLSQLAISGLSPEDEPSAQELEQVAAEATEAGVTAIFVEENLNPALAETLANELGLSTEVLQTLESLTSDQQAAGITYVSAQQANATAIATALRCG
jgi:zinc transport system substrate-binding protein